MSWPYILGSKVTSSVKKMVSKPCNEHNWHINMKMSQSPVSRCVSVTGSHQKRGEANIDFFSMRKLETSNTAGRWLTTWICLLEKVTTVSPKRRWWNMGKKSAKQKSPDRNTSKTIILLGQSGHQYQVNCERTFRKLFFMALNFDIYLNNSGNGGFPK